MKYIITLTSVTTLFLIAMFIYHPGIQEICSIMHRYMIQTIIFRLAKELCVTLYNLATQFGLMLATTMEAIFIFL